MKILLIEPNKKISQLLSENLTRHGYDIVSGTSATALAVLADTQPELVLFDSNLARYDELLLIKQIRTFSICPIILISSHVSYKTQAVAIDYGADDFVTKPFTYALLLAKINSQVRRVYGEYASEERVISHQTLHYYPEHLTIQHANQTEQLTKKEGQLLQLLVEASPRLVTRDVILTSLWDNKEFIDNNTLSVNITRLRKKINRIGLPNAIINIHSIGYRLNIK